LELPSFLEVPFSLELPSDLSSLKVNALYKRLGCFVAKSDLMQMLAGG
jgi:hypothetical protein